MINQTYKISQILIASGLAITYYPLPITQKSGFPPQWKGEPPLSYKHTCEYAYIYPSHRYPKKQSSNSPTSLMGFELFNTPPPSTFPSPFIPLDPQCDRHQPTHLGHQGNKPNPNLIRERPHVRHQKSPPIPALDFIRY